MLHIKRTVLAMVAAAGLAAAAPSFAQQKSVALVTIVEHPALDAVRD
ncbi:MAG: ABC transporter substrate-binding protein, partial [Kerstersia sp.]